MTLKKIAYLTAGISSMALILGITFCHAGERTECRATYNGVVCEYSDLVPVAPLRPLTPEEYDELADRQAKWEAFCQPRKTEGKDYITRYVYAHKDCDIGRAE